MSMSGEFRQVPASVIPELGKEGAIDPVMDADGLSVEKAWDALRYMLQGHDCEPFTSGTALEYGDYGYGPPLLMSPAEVKACSTRLAAITDEDFTARYDPETMTSEKVYPAIWDREDEREQNLAWLLGVFRKLRAFYSDAAKCGDGVVFFLT
jgi:hypothetical protein